MITVTIELNSITCYQSGRHYQIDKKDGEQPDQAEIRTWRERCHTNGNGVCYIPGIAFKRALETAASTLSIKVKGKGNQTYTKFFIRAIIPLGDLDLGVKKKDVVSAEMFVSSSGGKRRDSGCVTKFFPTFPIWGGEFKIGVLDPTITQAIFNRVLQYAAIYIGVGVWRPENGGMNGRFNASITDWNDDGKNIAYVDNTEEEESKVS